MTLSFHRWLDYYCVMVMVFKATFNNISVLLVEKTGENQTTDLSHITDKLAMSGI
jgi:hypothetical protein